MNALSKSKVFALVTVVSLLVSILFTGTVFAGSITINAPINLGRDVTDNKVMLNNTFTVNYTVTPEPIPVVAANPPAEKEFYLVLDTSGSMEFDLDGRSSGQKGYDAAKKRLKIAKAAAISFLTQLEETTNVKAGLITYSDVATIKKGLTKNFQEIKNAINNMNAVGGTNIGDGLRRAYYELSKGSSTAEKYIILLTDGEPTYHSYYMNKYKKYFFVDDGNAPNFTGGGSYATPDDINYCFNIAENKIKPSSINSYMIAFTKGSDANVLNQIAQKANGIYRQALDSSALDDVYSEIYDEIVSSFTVQNLTFEETFPEGLTVVSATNDLNISGQKVSGSLKSINYHLNDEGTYYIASPVEFSVTLSGDSVGTYTLGSGNSSKLTYKDINGTFMTKYFEPLNIEVASIIAPITTTRVIDKTHTLIDDLVTTTYTIIPGVITVDPDLFGGSLPTTLTVTDVQFSEVLPQGITAVSKPDGFNIANNTISGLLDPIVYQLNGDSTKYIADPIGFTVGIMADQPGSYTFDDADSVLTYTDLDGQVRKNYFGDTLLNAEEYGYPTVSIKSVKKSGEFVDITIEYTLPDFTASASIIFGGNTNLLGLSLSGERTFTGLSIYENHSVTISSTSITSLTRQCTTEIYKAIDVN